MKNKKITYDMNIKDMVMIMSENNINATTTIMHILKTPHGMENILYLDSINIRGSKIYNLYNDCCEKNSTKLNRTLTMIKCGIYEIEQIQENLNLTKAIPFIDDNLNIKDIPQYGEEFGPNHEKWEEFCQKNKETFINKLNAILNEEKNAKKIIKTK